MMLIQVRPQAAYEPSTMEKCMPCMLLAMIFLATPPSTSMKEHQYYAMVVYDRTICYNGRHTLHVVCEAD